MHTTPNTSSPSPTVDIPSPPPSSPPPRCDLQIVLGILSGANHNVIHLDNSTLPLYSPPLFLLPLREYGNVQPTLFIKLCTLPLLTNAALLIHPVVLPRLPSFQPLSASGQYTSPSPPLPPLSFSLSPSTPLGGDKKSSPHPGLVVTVCPPILHPPIRVEPYLPRYDDGDPIAYVRVLS